VSGPRVLVVDDEPQIRRSLRVALRANGYEVEEAATGQAALDLVATRPPELMILDLSLPDLDGVQVCKQLREWTQLPVIILSAHDEDEAKVRALDEGADDYVTKPFSVPELLARMRVAVRRAARAATDTPASSIRAGTIEIDLARRLVLQMGDEIHLTPTEYGVLRYLAEHAGRVVTHGQLLRSVMGPGYEDAVGSLRVYVASLRKKLEVDPAQPRIITTEPGVGYRFRAD
jgi:two-component system KDP operon response regulator KdpE